MVMFWLFLGLATASLSPGFSIETGSPDALCPELGATQTAVQARLGVVGVEGRAGWMARYTMWHAPDEYRDFVRLDLTDPSGARRLHRDLPLAGESCSTMANVIALVLERFFRELDGVRETAASTGGASTETEPVSPAHANPLAVLGLAGAAFPSPVQPGLMASLAVERRHLRVSMNAGWAASTTTETIGSSGSARLTTSVPIRWAMAWRSRLGRLHLHLGPEVFAAYERARSSIAIPGENSRLAVGAGVQAGAALFLGRHLRLTSDFAVDHVWGGGRFVVDDKEVLRLPWRGLAAIGVAYEFGDEGF
jgi:hypothetical protein